MKLRSFSMLLVGVIVSFSAGIAFAAADPAVKCAAGKIKAWSKYKACWAKVDAAYYPTAAILSDLAADYANCNEKLAKVWPKLQQLTGTACDVSRFIDQTVTIKDNLTGLVWEKKTDDATIHDKDNQYSWSTPAFPPANGTVFTSFIDTLNNPVSCFTGQCDWRLPTVAELATIVLPECTDSPCVSIVFVPTQIGGYVTRTEDKSPVFAWQVTFGDGEVDVNDKESTSFFARGVRGGLE